MIKIFYAQDLWINVIQTKEPSFLQGMREKGGV